MTRTVFDNAMTAHVWAQLAQPEGRSNNGNFYFEGPTLFSYGRHFVAGLILPAAPEEGEEARPLVTLINGDSYSISTGRHLSYAYSAARGSTHRIDGLTELARAVTRHAWAGEYALKPAPMKARREALPAIRRHFTGEPSSAPAMVAVFRAFGATPAESARWAAAATKAHARAELKRKQREEARERDARARDARNLSARPVADTLAAMRAGMAAPHFRAERAESEWRETARRMYRAKGEAARRGWAAMARKIEAHRKAIFATLPEFEAREIFNNRRAVVGRCVADIRAALSGSDDLKTASQFDRASDSAERLAGFEWVTARARVMGSPDLPARLMTLAADLAQRGGEAYKREERAAARSMVKKMREARHVANAAPTDDLTRVAIRLAALSAGHAAARDYAGAFSTPPRIFAAAGWTRDTFKAFADQLKARAESIRAEKGEAIREIAREEWRQTGEVTPETRRMAKDCGGAVSTYGGGFYGAALDDGNPEKAGALLRAVDVTRDESGTITGGTLVTSQHARVPLAHAIRVFRFLKRQREAGEEWRANGKTLPVGHFRVELVTAKGDFKAGCHWINWPEVARLAETLGLADMAPADTRETRAHA